VKPPLHGEKEGGRHARLLAGHREQAAHGAADAPPRQAGLRGGGPRRDHERPERERGGEEILAKRRLADRLGDDGVHGEKQGCEERGEAEAGPFPGRVGRTAAEHVRHHAPHEHDVQGMEKDAREVVTERVPPPDRRVEHQ
jgi:hypothetical protein